MSRTVACEGRSEEHTSELQSQSNLVCRLLLEKKNALDPLHQAYDEAGVPELLNNFVVVLAALGRTAEANSLFADALREFPGYGDASANLLAEQPTRLTLLPLLFYTVPTASELYNLSLHDALPI